jgi:hypothetical protein
MPTHDLIDNRNEQLASHIKCILASSTAEREHKLALTHGQKYLSREWQVLFSAPEDEEVKARINLLERAFRQEVTAVVKRELNLLRRNGVAGEDLSKSLMVIYRHHNLQEGLDRHHLSNSDRPIPRIMCSEGLV